MLKWSRELGVESSILSGGKVPFVIEEANETDQVRQFKRNKCSLDQAILISHRVREVPSSKEGPSFSPCLHMPD